MTLKGPSVESFGLFSKAWTSWRGRRHDAQHRAVTICGSRSGRSHGEGWGLRSQQVVVWGGSRGSLTHGTDLHCIVFDAERLRGCMGVVSG